MYIEQGGQSAIRTLTGFLPAQFNILYGYVETELVSHWVGGRGRKPKVKPKDSFLMLLTVLKYYNTWAKHALDFGLSTLTFEKLIHKVITIVEPLLTEALIRPVSMASQRAKGRLFTNYPYALYATDVKFQPCFRPAGTHDESKRFFSNKHKLYGLKIEVSVAYPGQAINISDAFPGSKAFCFCFAFCFSRVYSITPTSRRIKS